MNSVDWLRMFKDKVMILVNNMPDTIDHMELKRKIGEVYQDQLQEMITPSSKKKKTE